MKKQSKKEKYADYYKMGKVNINNFINGLNVNDLKKLRQMYEEICEEENTLLSDLEVQKQKLSKTNISEEAEDIKFEISWLKRKLEFIRIKKDIVQNEKESNEIEK